MPINTPHPEHEYMTERWRRCRDCAAGSDAVKDAGELYLPRPEGMERRGNSYNSYRNRALFYNSFSRTVDGLSGMIFQKAPDVTVPKPFERWLGDVTSTDQDIEGLALDIVREILIVGRCGLLVDLPKVGAAGTDPYMIPIYAENLISWSTESRGGNSVLTRAVIRETVMEVDPDDESEIKMGDRYRELSLSNEGVYQVRIWTKLPGSHVRDHAGTIWEPTVWIVPQRLGEPLGFIPLTIINAASLGAHIGRPPLIDLADVNLSHYRSSADRENSLFWVSQPTPWTTGATGDNPLRIGSSVAWSLPEGATVGMLEHSGKGIGALGDAMLEKQRLMVTLGARTLEEQPTANETATAVRQRHSGEQASLRVIAQVAGAGLTKAVRQAIWWAQNDPTPADVDASVTLNTDFIASKMTPEELKAMLLAWQSDGVSFETLHANLVRGGVMRPDVSAQEELAAIQRGTPLAPLK